jgi:hypothetical protein
MIIPFKQDEASYAYPLRVRGTLGILVDVKYLLLLRNGCKNLSSITHHDLSMYKFMIMFFCLML